MARRSGRILATAALAALLLMTLGAGTGFAAEEGAKPGLLGRDNAIIALSVAVVVSASCIAAGYAVGRVGSAALGAASERPELLTRALILVGLAEGIAIYGLIIGIMLVRLIKV